MQVEHEAITVARAGDSFGMKVIDHVRDHDEVYKSPSTEQVDSQAAATVRALWPGGSAARALKRASADSLAAWQALSLTAGPRRGAPAPGRCGRPGSKRYGAGGAGGLVNRSSA